MSAIWFLTLVGLILLKSKTSFAVLPIQISDFSCAQNDEFCKNLDCNFITVRQRMQVLNFEVEFVKTLKSVRLHFQLFKKNSQAEFKPFMIDVSESVCKFLADTERSNLISRMMPNWKHYGSFPLNCPVVGVVYVRRYPLDLSFYPSTFPAGEFLININLIEDFAKLSILNASVSFAVKY